MFDWRPMSSVTNIAGPLRTAALLVLLSPRPSPRRRTSWRQFLGAVLTARPLSPLRELPQEAQIVSGEVANIVNAVAQHGDALDAQPEGEATIDRRIVADAAQHTRVNHAGAAHFKPARIFAYPTARSVAVDTVHIELSAWLGEREVAGAETYLAVGPEEFASEPFDHAAQLGHRAGLVNQQSLHLMEDGLMAGVNRLIAIDPPWHNGSHRRAHLLHDANLVRRGLCAQQYLPRRYPEGILHVAGGMILRNIQRLEVVVVGLHLRPLVDLEAHLTENPREVACDQRERMRMPAWDRAPRQRHIQPFAFERRRLVALA